MTPLLNSPPTCHRTKADDHRTHDLVCGRSILVRHGIVPFDVGFHEISMPQVDAIALTPSDSAENDDGGPATLK